MPDVTILNVLLHDQSIGTLTRLPGDRNLFAFKQDYIDNQKRPTLSLSFKDMYGDLITEVNPTRTRVPPFFANLLPEGHMREYLASRASVHPNREFFLLWVLGSDLPGAITLESAEVQSWPDEVTDENLKQGKREKNTPLRFSLAGIQIKFSAITEPTGGLTIPVDGIGGSWIVKLPSTQFEGVPENEFAMMELARRVGIAVPETKLVSVREISGMPSEINTIGEKAFAIKRFDRSTNGDRIHIEDFAQIFGVYPDKKYKTASYRNIAEVIWTEIGEPGIIDFIRRLVFNALIGNGDMHLKNWSLIYRDERTPELAPAYDFVSTIPYIPNDALALSFLDSRDFDSLTIDQFKRFAAKARLPEKVVLDAVRDTVESFKALWNAKGDFYIADKVRVAITSHLAHLPIFKE